MKDDRSFSNADVTFKLTYNFSLDEWEDKLTGSLSKEFLRKADIYLQDVIAKRFTVQRSPEGVPWKRLSPITKKFKGSGRRLFLSGDLAQSFRTSFGPDTISIITDVPYARIQQEGATFTTTKRQSIWMWHNLFNRTGSMFARRRITIPARPFFGFNKKNINDLRKIMRNLIKESERLGV